MRKALLAVGAALLAVLVAAGAWLAFGAGGDGETTSRGTCGNATYELSAEDEDGGLEVTFELQSGSPGEVWTVVIEQDGRTVMSGDRRTDEDAELDVDVTVNEDDGTSFAVTATPESGEACTASVDR